MRRAAIGLILAGTGCSERAVTRYYREATAGQTDRVPMSPTPISGGSSTLTTDAGSDDGPSPNSGLPFHFCQRIGSTPVARLGRVRRRLREIVRLSHLALMSGHDYVLVGRKAALNLPFARIAQDYDAHRSADCRTAGLLPPLDAARRDEWWDYLLNYSNALAGCPLVVTPLPGGVDAFGPANTGAIGIQHPLLTELAAELLIEQYLAAFTSGFELTASDASLVEVHLRSAAAAQIQPGASDWTSRCGLDAGRADSGAADAGGAGAGNP